MGLFPMSSFQEHEVKGQKLFGGDSYHGTQQELKRWEQKHVMPLKVVIWNGYAVLSTHDPLAKTSLMAKSGADRLRCILYLFYSEIVSSYKQKEYVVLIIITRWGRTGSSHPLSYREIC